MKYRAREVYQNRDTVRTYDIARFATFKGRLVDKREKYLIYRALRYAGVNPPAVILDVPCGTGRLSIYLAQKGFKVRGTDLSPEMIALTREKLKDQKLTEKIMVEVEDAESLSYPSNSFDAAVCLRLFGHTPPQVRKKILRELNRIIKRYLVLMYSHKNCLQGFLRKKSRSKKRIEWHPVTYKQIEEELDIAGLEKVKCFFLLPGISETVMVLAKKRGNEYSANK